MKPRPGRHRLAQFAGVAGVCGLLVGPQLTAASRDSASASEASPRDVLQPPVTGSPGPDVERLDVRVPRVCLRRARGCTRPRAVIRFEVNSDAVIRGRIFRNRRRGRLTLVRTFFTSGSPRRVNGRRLPVQGLPSGRYRLRMQGKNFFGDLGDRTAAFFRITDRAVEQTCCF